MTAVNRDILPELTDETVEEEIRRWSELATGSRMWKRYWQCHNEIVQGLQEAGLAQVETMSLCREDELRYQKAEAEMFLAAYKARAYDYTLQRDYDFDLATDYIIYLMAHSGEGRDALKHRAREVKDFKERIQDIVRQIDNMLQRSMSL